MSKVIPVIITCDIDPTPEVSVQEKRMALQKSLDLFKEYDVRTTFFFVANVINEYQSLIPVLLNQDHEIGCHGLSHDEKEEFNRLEESEQRRILTRATSIIHNVTGFQVSSFRGPRVKTSHITQSILEDLNYRVDSSVCSQRIDFFSSNLINTKWIFAPRLPYHPHNGNAFKRGNRSIWVVPVSAIMLPFVSGTLYTFGIKFTMQMFNYLYSESRKTGKPIVYLLHPVEFAHKTKQRSNRYSLLVEGFQFRRSKLIFEQDIQKRYTNHQELFNHMKSFGDVHFMTMREYIEKKENHVFT
jgi:peptidoglycan/xylan/chitin deacetylase (PgdA/CDA1 family)